MGERAGAKAGAEPMPGAGWGMEAKEAAKMILITGARGFVGSRAMERFPGAAAFPSELLRSGDAARIAAFVQDAHPQLILHTAAISDIGQCEKDPEASYAANVRLPVALARGAAAVGAKLLHIKPSIEVESGAMVVGKKYRGSFARSLEHYVKDKLENRSEIDFSRVIVAYSPCDAGVTEHLLAFLDSVADFRETLVCAAGSTICCHCGPNTLGIIFKRKTPKA